MALIFQTDKVRVTSKYGTRKNHVNGVIKKHTGIDLSRLHHDNVIALK